MTNPSVNPATRFGLLRHAQTAWNREKRIQGQSDSPLSATGLEQAAKWAAILAGFHWDRLLTSDLERARATARILNRTLSLPRHTDARLREQDWGHWVGRTVAGLRREDAALEARESAGWDFRPPGGEDRRSLRDRSRSALIEAARRWPGTSILVVTHEGVIKALVYDLLGRGFLPGEPKIFRKGYFVHRVRVFEGKPAIEELHGISLG